MTTSDDLHERERKAIMWQLVYAGLAGGRKGVPESVAQHLSVFATLPAPSFAADDGGPVAAAASNVSRRKVAAAGDVLARESGSRSGVLRCRRKRNGRSPRSEVARRP